MMIEDPTVRRRIEEEIDGGVVAESAVKIVITEYADRFLAMPDEYLRARAVDVREAGQRILRHLLGVAHDQPDLDQGDVLVAHELTLADLAMVDPAKLSGIVTAIGGANSHVAILTKSLGIPTVVGAEGVLEACDEGDTVVVDGNTGSVHIRPTEQVLSEYRRLEAERRSFQRELEPLRNLPAETTDGHRIKLYANVGLISELDMVERSGAEGIGLYRSEFPFLSYRDFPSEDEQLRLYSRVIERMKGQPVTVRTLDLGADKYPAHLPQPVEQNPFLGWRSIRVSLELEHIFVEQLRAILRAAGEAPVRIMFPLVTGVEELRRVRELYTECLSDLALRGIAPPSRVELGCMIEVPAAVIRAPQILREVDFVSIGTNDLIQYTLAVDRDNRKVAPMYQPLHPAVLSSIRTVVAAAHDAGRSVSLCGEMAGDPLATILLLGMGLDELSMSALYVPVVKKVIRAVSYSDACAIAADVARFDTVEEIKGYLFARMREFKLMEALEAFS